jgi:hypothetical protein
MPAKYIHPIIRQIIDRDCHVGECNRMVVRHVIAQLKDGNETFRRMPMAERRKFVEQCLAQHAANRRLFSEVMTGFPATRKREQELAKQVQSVSGKELVSLMNEHGKSSEFMAFRLGTTLQKVRKARVCGLTGAVLIGQWIRALASDDSANLPRKYRILDRGKSLYCGFCGIPFVPSDHAFEFTGEVFCSIACCRFGQGW